MESPLMKCSFLICGYPRSRTLWLANFFTIPGLCKCEHEATQWSSSSEQFWKRADRICDEPVYGNSDSAGIFVLPALLAVRPLTKVIWIERPINDVIRSMRKAGFPFTKESVEFMVNARLASESLFDLKISFSMLQCLSTMLRLWRFLMEEEPFDYGRWGILEATKLAYTFSEYLERPRDMSKLLEFIRKEGEIRCQS